MNSKLGTLNLNDAWKGLVLVVFTAIIEYILQNLAGLQIVADPVINQGILYIIAVIGAYLLKQLGTDEKGKTLGVKL